MSLPVPLNRPRKTLVHAPPYLLRAVTGPAHRAFWGDCCPISPQAAPGHTPATPGPGAVFPGPPGPGIAAVGLPPQPRQLRAEPATPSPAGRLLALAGEQPGAAPGSTSGARAFCALAHLLRRAPAPHVSARRGGDYCRGRGLREGADPQG